MNTTGYPFVRHGALAVLAALLFGTVAVAAQASMQELLHAAGRGDTVAMKQLGHLHSHGQGVEKNQRRALEWYMQAAERGDADAQYFTGLMYYQGLGIDSDHAQSLHWFEKAAGQGHVKAGYMLGLQYYYGRGVDRDLQEGSRLIEAAARQGDADAQYMMGWMLTDGGRPGEMTEEALNWLNLAAEQDQAYAAYLLGSFYEIWSHGWVDAGQAEALARKWYLRSAEAGFGDAMLDVSEMYERGEFGQKPDPEKARAWLLKAAEQGHGPAQATLGEFYSDGRPSLGLKKDPQAALKWYLLAVKDEEVNQSEMALRLGKIYRDGIGTPRDLVKARYWLGRAAANALYTEAREALAQLDASPP